jgi:putative oxidoreductase
MFHLFLGAANGASRGMEVGTGGDAACSATRVDIEEDDMGAWGSLSGAWSPRVLSVLRIVTALLFIPHGTQKLFGVPGAQQAVPALMSMMGIVGILECVGGLLILLGVFTRPAAFVLSGHMAVAYFMAHAPRGFWPILNRGELAALYCFVFLYLAVAGGGPWSLGRFKNGTRRR